MSATPAGALVQEKLDPSGNLITGWGGTRPGGQLNSFGGELGGIAVDAGNMGYAYNTSAQMLQISRGCGSASGSSRLVSP